QSDLFFRTIALAHIFQGLVVYREVGDGTSEFGRHIAYGGPVRYRKMIQSRSEDFYKFPDNALFPKRVRYGQYQIGGRRAKRKFSGQFKAYYLGHNKVDGLPQNGGLRLYAAYASSYHADPVYHGRVAVGSYQGIGKDLPISFNDPLGEIFQVYLMADAHPRGDHPKIVKGFLCPF